MSKEIREVLDTLCAVAKVKDLTKSPTGFDDEVENAMLELSELGVVVKVARELPEIPLNEFEAYTEPAVVVKCRTTQIKMLEAGYVAVKPLIEEKE